MKTFKRYLRDCDTWMACAYEAEKGCIGVEYGSERNQIFHYVFKGSARVGKLFSGDPISIRLILYLSSWKIQKCGDSMS